MFDWVELSWIISEEQVENFTEQLENLGALSVTYQAADDEEIFQEYPNEQKFWNVIKISALIPSNISPYIQQTMGNAQSKNIKDEDWVKKSQAGFPPQCFNEKLWVVPSFYQGEKITGKQIIVDPGLAFGTGHHATTRLCLNWLTEQTLQNKVVIDYGCGSGILALSAWALGAKTIFAVDHDPQALQATQNNMQLNHVKQKNFHVLFSQDLIDVKADVVIANILTKVLIILAPVLKTFSSKNSHLFLSGILRTEVEQILQVFLPEYQLQKTYELEDWAGIELKFIM